MCVWGGGGGGGSRELHHGFSEGLLSNSPKPNPTSSSFFIKNSLSGSVSYPDFREIGPWSKLVPRAFREKSWERSWLLVQCLKGLVSIDFKRK